MIRFPPKKILVPFDFTDASLSAWRQANELALRFGAEVEALYVEDLLPGDAWEPFRGRVTPGLRRTIIRHLRAKLAPRAGKIHVMEGDPALSILSLVRRSRPDLLVMGATSRRGLARLWSGSVAEAVVHSSPVPVLTLRALSSRIHGVLAPVNFADHSEFGLAYAAAAAAALNLPLTVLHALRDPARCPNPRSRLIRLLDRLPPAVREAQRPRIIVKSAPPVEAILETAGEHSLIVLVARRKSLLEELVLGTTAERVLRHARCPTLAVPAPASPFARARWKSEAEAPASGG